MQPTVFLFDLDGVLVKPGGYRASVRAAVNYFANQLGLGDVAPADETIAIFEAQGITCEWDMVPLLLVIVLEAALTRAPRFTQINSFQTACSFLRSQPLNGFEIDFAPVLRRLGGFVRAGEAPSDSILAACRSGQAADLFPNLSGQGVLVDLLSNTRHLTRSRTTLIFEAFALGDAVFTQATGLPLEIKSASLLVQNDEPLLDPTRRDHLRKLAQEQGLRMAAYTARPSLPLGQPDELLALYAPEAEMALERIGWKDLPLVGSGQMGVAACALDELEDRLVKPAPYHSIAAIATAWTGNWSAALAWTELIFRYFERGEGPCPTLVTTAGELPRALELHIFEDSPAGMLGGKHAAEMLAHLGLQVHLNLWGVSAHVEKAAALASVGAQVFIDVNQAIDTALNS